MPNLEAWNIVCSSYPVKSVSETDPKTIIPCIFRTTVDCETLVIVLVVRPGNVEIRVNCDDLLGQWEQGEKQQQRRSVAYAWDVDAGDARSESITVAEGFSFVCSVLEGGFWDSAKEMTLEIEGRKSDIRDQLKCENLGYQYWMRLLEMFPRTTELSVSARYVTHLHMGANPIVLTTHDGLSMALAESRKDDNGATQLICPHLERLNLFGMKLKTGLPHLGRALSFRAKCGNRLNFLYISVSPGVTEAADSIVRADIAARFINVVDEDELDGALELDSDDDGCIS